MTLKKSRNKILAVAALLLALLGLMMLDLVPALTVKAAAAGSSEAEAGIGYYVRAVLPDNQIDDNLTYFDLRMQPGATQTLEVEVVNESGERITVDVAAISASTNRNGIIDYKTPDIRDKTLTNPFSALASPAAGSLTIEAGGTALARVKVQMPATQYDGVVLGGLVFTRQPGAADEGEGVVLQNVYSYVLGVKLSESDAEVLPAFELESVKAETVNYQPAYVHLIRNSAAAIAKGIDLHIVVRDAAGNVVGEFECAGVDMAPNSTMPLGVTPLNGGSGTAADSGGQSTGTLVPGEYESEVTLEYGGERQSFKQKFTVGSVEAEAINAEVPGNTPQAGLERTTEVWLVVVLALAGAVILVLLFIILVLLRRKKDKEAEGRYK